MKWPWTREHRHELRPVRVQHTTGAHPLFQTTPIDATVVLYHCSCGLAQTQMLVGKWTMDDISGRTPAEAADALIAASKDRP